MVEGVVMKKICLLFLFIASIFITPTFLFASDRDAEREAALGEELEKLMAIKAPKIEDLTHGQLLGFARSQSSTMEGLIDTYEGQITRLREKLTGHKLATSALMAGDAIMRKQLEQRLQVVQDKVATSVTFVSGIIKAIEGDAAHGLPVEILARLEQALAVRDAQHHRGVIQERAEPSSGTLAPAIMLSLESGQREEIDRLQKKVADSALLYDNCLRLIKDEEVAQARSNRRLRDVVIALQARDGKVEEVALQSFEALLEEATTPATPKTPDPE
jgi:hypothetical protein